MISFGNDHIYFFVTSQANKYADVSSVIRLQCNRLSE